ncbi:hypothetical protein ACROYT_G035048 [Oculina patagonica]
MASSIEKKLAKHLECPICLEKFVEPKVLSCQHTYCRKCLEKLVARLDRENYEVTCPECRASTKVPGGDVNRLPANFLINNLLSLHDDTQPSKKSATCAKHDGETLKLFCQSCEEPICRDCTVIDHHGHRYLFIKDIFVAEKEKVLKIVQESKATICVLESSVATVDAQEEKLQESSVKVRECIDGFINAQIEILKAKGEHLKNELQMAVATQEEDFHAQKDTLFLSLGCLKSSLELTEQVLSRGDEAAVLKAKSQLSQQLKQSTARARVKPRDATLHTLEINAPLNNETVLKMAHITKHDEKYKLSVYGGNFGHLEETYVDKVCHFVISKEKSKKHDFLSRSDLCKEHSLPLLNVSSLEFAPSILMNCAHVRIKSPGSINLRAFLIKGENDSFLFSYRPDEIGTYTIEIIINGRYVQGSPFAWIVKGFVTSRQYRKMDDEYD